MPLTSVYIFLSVVLILLLLLVVFRKAVGNWLKSSQDKEAKAKLKLMAGIIQGLCSSDPKWKRDRWPTAGRLHTFINTNIPEKDRASRANVRDHVAKRYGLDQKEAMTMLRYYRGKYIAEAERVYIKEKSKESRLARKAKERAKGK